MNFAKKRLNNVAVPILLNSQKTQSEHPGLNYPFSNYNKLIVKVFTLTLDLVRQLL